MKKVFNPISLDNARDIVLNSIAPLNSEEISIMEANGRILYNDIISHLMNPPLNNSGMDGYAVISENIKGASKLNPVTLKIINEIQAGGNFDGIKLISGTCVRIMTGAPIPENADAVIQSEDTEEDNGYVKIFRESSKFENFRFAGEDIKKGDIVLHHGEKITSADCGILASLNYKQVKVYRRPHVSIISTGNELAEIGDDIHNGQIRNSNSYVLYSEVKKYGAIPEYIGVAKDTIEATQNRFKDALKSDIIISTGGVSMGKYDFVKEIYRNLEIDIKFQRLNVKPGRPCVFGIKGNKLFFGLPGNPVSMHSSFIQFVRPAILKFMGANKLNKPIINATIEEDIDLKTGPGLLHLLRGRFTIKENEFHVSTTGLQGSNILTSMSIANCIIIIPEHVTNIKAGNKVSIQLINHDEIN